MKNKFPDHARKAFGILLRMMRQRTLHNGRTLTQKALGKHLRYKSGSQVSLWEKGERLPKTREIVQKIAVRCHCSSNETKELLNTYKSALMEELGL